MHNRRSQGKTPDAQGSHGAPGPDHALFRAIADALPFALYTTDEAGLLTYFNDGAARLWGHRPVPGQTQWCGAWQLCKPDNAPMAADECAAAIAITENREQTTTEAVAVQPDGTKVPFVTQTTILRDDAGAIIGTLNILNQNTVPTLAARDKPASAIGTDAPQSELWDAINAIRDGFVIYDKSDRLVLANEAFKEIHREVADLLVPGASFEYLTRAGLERKMWNIGDRDPENWVQAQLEARRRGEDFETEVELANGRRIVRREYRTRNGETVGIRIDVTEDRTREAHLRTAKKQLEIIAYFDELTGLANRSRCKLDITERISEGEPSDRFSFLNIGLDNFKRSNDTHGHAAGDRILRTIGRRLKCLADDCDGVSAYRWGGDEFIVLFDRTGDRPTTEICDELTDIIAFPIGFGTTTVWPTASIGIARYPEDGADFESLMVHAGLALNKAKVRGRDGYNFFTQDLKEKVLSDSWIEAELRDGLKSGQLYLAYQPQISVMDGRVKGFEALIRWNHPDKGEISPSVFLPVTETTRMAINLGQFVFDQAMKTARTWSDDGLEFGRVSVNLSPHHMKLGGLLNDFCAAMDRHGVRPDRVGAEIVESVFFDGQEDEILQIMNRLHDMGVHIELDDFGTGFASLTHLCSLPINGIKIDRSFVDEMASDQKKSNLVEMLFNLAGSTGLDIVCEGVETRDQFECLKQIGDCLIQGYLVAKPMRLEQATEWLVGRHSGAGTLPEKSQQRAEAG